VSAVPLEIWIATIVGLVAIVVLDLAVIARRNRTVSIRDATLWVIFYVGLAAAFAGALFVFRPENASEFVAGYITEYSLSVDNLFVFVIIMARFAVPSLAQDKALYIGIILSLVLRAVFIAAGAAAIAAASWVFYLFGGFLVYTAVKLALEKDDEDDDFTQSRAVRGLRRVLPLSTEYDEARISTRASGRRMLTPLALVIAVIGLANVIFALDSIPAIFGLTQDAYIVFTANAFALMGLRQLYFLIGGLLERLVYLNYGLSAILGFIGVKLLIEALHGSGVDVLEIPLPDIGTVFSLEFIVGALVITTLLSLGKSGLEQRRSPAKQVDDAVEGEQEQAHAEPVDSNARS
jgi:TerC family integral membrane protein